MSPQTMVSETVNHKWKPVLPAINPYNQRMILGTAMAVHRHRVTKGLRVLYPLTREPSVSGNVVKLISVEAPSNLSPLRTNEFSALGPYVVLSKLHRFLSVPYFIIIYIFVHYSPGCCHCSFICFCFFFTH